MEGVHKILEDSEYAARILAYRLTRRAVLKRFCQEGHSVLAIEDDLVEMARSKFHEAVLIVKNSKNIPWLCELLKKMILEFASEKAAGYDEDQSVRDEIVSEVCLEALNDIKLVT